MASLGSGLKRVSAGVLGLRIHGFGLRVYMVGCESCSPVYASPTAMPLETLAQFVLRNEASGPTGRQTTEQNN